MGSRHHFKQEYEWINALFSYLQWKTGCLLDEEQRRALSPRELSPTGFSEDFSLESSLWSREDSRQTRLCDWQRWRNVKAVTGELKILGLRVLNNSSSVAVARVVLQVNKIFQVRNDRYQQQEILPHQITLQYRNGDWVVVEDLPGYMPISGKQWITDERRVEDEHQFMPVGGKFKPWFNSGSGAGQMRGEHDGAGRFRGYGTDSDQFRGSSTADGQFRGESSVSSQFTGDRNDTGDFRSKTSRPISRGYDRAKAAAYADKWWNSHNPAYLAFEDDCTNYVSQCIHAGGIPMEYTGSRNTGWWYRHQGGARDNWSFSWAVAHSLQWYLSSNTSGGIQAKLVSSADQLSVGDVICYDFDGDGRWQHNTIVVAKDGNGMPLVNAHTANSRHRNWDYQDSYAWNERIKYKFFHIIN